MFKIISLLLVMVMTTAFGKIEYIPYPSRAAAMTAINYLLLSEPDNLIGVNPGFETGDLTGWVAPTGGVTVTTTGTYEGTYKAEIEGIKSLKTNQPFSLSKSNKYKLGLPCKNGTGTGQTIYWFIYDENDLVVASGSAVATAAWKMNWFNFTAPVNSFNCHLTITNGGGAGATSFLDGFEIRQEYLDMGLEDFSIDILHQPLTQTGLRSLVRKCSDDGTTRGIHFAFSWTDYKYYFTIADGTNSVTASSAAVSAIQNQQYHWVRVVLDRSGNISFYVNGVQSGSSTAISTVGNCSVINELRLFGFNSTDYLYKGWCDFIRFQRGTIRSAAWMASEWARIQAGRKRMASSATAMWDFNDNLVDECQGLILAENTGTITYADGWPYCVSPISYTFGQNFTYDYQIIPKPSDSIVRSYRTGAAYLTAGPRKYSYTLPFTCIEEAQMSAFFAAWEGGEPVKLWLDANEEQTDEVYFVDPPEKHSKAAFRAGNYVYDTELHLEGT